MFTEGDPAERAKIDPTLCFIEGPGRIPLARALGVNWGYVQAVDAALAARGTPEEFKKRIEDVQQINELAGRLKMPEIVIDEAQKALKQVPIGAERRGEAISAALLKQAREANINIQEVLDSMVAEGKLTGDQANKVEGWVGMELFRLAAQAREVNRMDSPRAEVLEAVNPLKGQIANKGWTADSWEQRINEARNATRGSSLRRKSRRTENWLVGKGREGNRRSSTSSASGRGRISLGTN